MSTRCQIRIVRNGYPLNYYHHCDGYFSGVGKELQGWMKECVEQNNGKLDDCLDEQMVVYRIMRDTGYEPTFSLHSDIEYFYLLDFDRLRFKAYRTQGFSPWSSEGDDEYDPYKPWYDQTPRFSEERDILNDSMDGE